MILEIGSALLSATVVGGTTYISKAVKTGTTEVFSASKFAQTLIIGLILGIITYASGVKITATNWDIYLASNAGVIAIADQGVKFLIRIYQKFSTK